MPDLTPDKTADLRYPIGKFQAPGAIDSLQRESWISAIDQLPGRLRAALVDLSPAQLETAYRPGGWTVRQVVHHLADSHMNAYIRFRLASTEDAPVIKPYNEAAWAELEDAKTAPIELSLALLEVLHKRWIILLKSIKSEDFERSYMHPELGKTSLNQALALYSWHGQHHLAHVLSIRA